MKTVKKAALVIAAAGVAAGASTGSAFAHGGAAANGSATKSPGVGSGNLVQAPVHIPANVSGNSVSVIGVLNPVFGNHAQNF
ncbi:MULTISPECIES: chaplin [unclassified Streptomyces]|uniref:chaplin n=1 Tax=unclassified Streptomyces TaxID=2593676 RepID=UPI002DD96105|nr:MULTISPECIES: chaplin [unclassified Streptomyces]WSA95703.1 chaplin [Streptomyces sp. NBC_01795]WSB80122.1 chaplin [Streptomyces sp. NBC_01775]WSS11670.1 chaplin [Streptomyces sp. NBC_01186]WSS40383.1 chaplin [Streptomyces sp. NBC_01187]